MASNVLDTSAEYVDFSSGHVHIPGVIESSETRDVFKVSLGSNPTIAMFSGNAYLNESIKLELMDSEGNTIRHLENRSGPGNYYFDGVIEGEYFFVVTSDAAEDIDYGLSLNEYRSSVDEGTPDPEPRPDDADEMGPDATEWTLTNGIGEMYGTLETKGDVDVFRFSIGEFDYLDLRGLPLDGSEALSVRLFFGDGRHWNFVMIENSQVLVDSRELVGSHFQRLPPGEYFLVVSGDTSQAVDYQISIRAYNFPRYQPDEVIDVLRNEDSNVDDAEEIALPFRSPSESMESTVSQGVSGKNTADAFDDNTLSTQRIWHNESSPADVNADGRRTPLDVLLIVEWLNDKGASSVASAISVIESSGAASNQSRFLDVNGNGKIEPLDALLAINELNREANLKLRAEGEAAQQLAVNVDWIFSKLDDD
jgi:Dockerin type I domain